MAGNGQQPWRGFCCLRSYQAAAFGHSQQMQWSPFQPLVFEAQGGMCSETAAVLHGVAFAAVGGLGRDASSVKQELLSKISVILARPAANSIHRRPAARRDLAPVLQLLQAERFCTEPPEGA